MGHRFRGKIRTRDPKIGRNRDDSADYRLSQLCKIILACKNKRKELENGRSCEEGSAVKWRKNGTESGRF